MSKYILTNGRRAILQHNLKYLSSRVDGMSTMYGPMRGICCDSERDDINSILKNMPFPLARCWKMQAVHNRVLIPKSILWMFSTRHLMIYSLKTFNPTWFLIYYKDLINKTTLRTILTASAFKNLHIPVSILSRPNFKWYLHCLTVSQHSNSSIETKTRKNGESK